MGAAATPPCANCARLQKQLDAQQARLDALVAQVAQLQEQLAAARKDSSTSSKPPSSDIVKPRPAAPADGARRSIGGQPGHPKHDREPFPAEQVSHFAEHTLDACPCCGGPVRPNGSIPKVVQQVDVRRPPLVIEQHTSPEYWCAAR